MYPQDVAQELVRQAKDVHAPLRSSLTQCFHASILDARLLHQYDLLLCHLFNLVFLFARPETAAAASAASTAVRSLLCSTSPFILCRLLGLISQ